MAEVVSATGVGIDRDRLDRNPRADVECRLDVVAHHHGWGLQQPYVGDLIQGPDDGDRAAPRKAPRKSGCAINPADADTGSDRRIDEPRERVLEIPADAVLQLATELYLRHLRLDVHLQWHHVELFDDLLDRSPGLPTGAHKQRVGFIHGRHANLLPTDFQGGSPVSLLRLA